MVYQCHRQGSTPNHQINHECLLSPSTVHHVPFPSMMWVKALSESACSDLTALHTNHISSFKKWTDTKQYKSHTKSPHVSLKPSDWFPFPPHKELMRWDVLLSQWLHLEKPAKLRSFMRDFIILKLIITQRSCFKFKILLFPMQIFYFILFWFIFF